MVIFKNKALEKRLLKIEQRLSYIEGTGGEQDSYRCPVYIEDRLVDYHSVKLRETINALIKATNLVFKLGTPSKIEAKD